MPIRSLFTTPFYEEKLGEDALFDALDHSCRTYAREDKAGRAWSREHLYPGYTSYASLNDLPRRDPDFDDLKRLLDKHVKRFAKACHFGDEKLKLNSLWINVLKPGGMHSGHIHPHSVVSGTVYVSVPKGAGGLRLEDPRLPAMMAAPVRSADAPEEFQPFVTAKPERGTLYLWESWLRHEVLPGTAKADRVSISFNYG